MTLEEVNQELLSLLAKIEEILPKLTKIELTYETRYNDLILHSGMGTVQLKDAEAKSICSEEGLYEPVTELKMQMRILYMKKDILIEYSKNLREISHSTSDVNRL